MSSRFAHTRIGNGRVYPADVDGRSHAARRFRELVHSLTNEAGGDDALSSRQKLLVRQVASLQFSLEGMETLMVEEPERYSATDYAKVANSLRRAQAELFGKAVAAKKTRASAELASIKREFSIRD